MLETGDSSVNNKNIIKVAKVSQDTLEVQSFLPTFVLLKTSVTTSR